MHTSQQRRWVSLLIAVLLCAPLLGCTATAAAPITPPPSLIGVGQDPSVVLHEGFYYLVQSINGDRDIAVSRAPTLADLAHASREIVWHHRPGSWLCCNVWAPELFYDQGHWYIYFAADDGDNANHRMYALVSVGNDPRGPYREPVPILTPDNRWAIDGVPLRVGSALYFLWSGWEGTENGQQNLYIAAMRDPLTVVGERTLIAAPSEPWERRGFPYVNEAPQPLERHGRLFVIFSASGSWTDDYCLGLLSFLGGDPRNPAAWVKANGCVFSKVAGAYGPGHCSFTRSHDGTEDWIVYHANLVSNTGWPGRTIRAQRFSWSPDGYPEFGVPIGLASTP
jgi:GH43 family beta-xylosidase